MNVITTAWLAELIAITYRGSKQKGNARPIPGVALPFEYASTFIIYGALSLIPEGPASRVAGLFGWGLVVATVLNLWSPPGATPGPPAVKQVPGPKAAPAPSKA